MSRQGLRLFHTARYLRRQQIAYRIWYRLQKPSPDPRPAPAVRSMTNGWVAPIDKPVAMVAADRFRFLNVEHPLSSAADWNHPDRPKLWLYNLHYFDDLTASNAIDRSTWHHDLIRRWLAENPPAQGNGWEPYPVSLRIVNWIKWALAERDRHPESKVPVPLSAEVLHSLAVQSRYLRKRLEYHLLGNHLFANAKALVFAGLFFQGEEAEEWLSRGLKILGAEIPEQILPDGGNFERSPMYHAIIHEDLLDLVNLYRAYGRDVHVDWLDACIRMRAWLKAMSHPEGGIALFNDAAFGIAPNWAELDAYAERLGLSRQEYPPRPLTRFPETGYVRCEKEAAVLLLDVAPVGPDYIPGHAHADTLNFELSLFGRRVIVDSGTSTYEKNAERQRQRGTAAHNTVTINGEDSSEVWGGFRVARRARPFDVETGERAGKVRVACAHDGYRRLPGKPVHRREWQLAEGELLVRDTIEGKFREAIARYHFHPEVQVELGSAGEGRGTLSGGEGFTFQVEKGTARLIDTTWHPEFNVSLPNRCLEVVLDGHAAEVRFVWQ